MHITGTDHIGTCLTKLLSLTYLASLKQRDRHSIESIPPKQRDRHCTDTLLGKRLPAPTLGNAYPATLLLAYPATLLGNQQPCRGT
uniref:Uncharacterized protein n=1 Tax=Picea glauca TaxID=3330 RepID=A0A101LYG3_PICGL|nr:hypothetical protein ABT39_MTgene5871 [Picea glauca]QHR92104.1 hypothetical protein Q903MT_gene6140 [Picea sitchensis]